MVDKKAISRYRKVCEHLDDLREIVTNLQSEKSWLEAEVLGQLKPSDFNCVKTANVSRGIVDSEVFTVTESERLVRFDGGSIDNQDWLSELDISFGDYVSTKYELMRSKVIADFRAGNLSRATLQLYGLGVQKTLSLTVSRLPSDAAVTALKEQAEALTE